jgi:UDP-N-acetylglucosamine 2-epimerase (non-hydrolysing)
MLAAALTGVKLGLPVAHVEAGLRSYDWRMPEEHNRRMVDHVSDILFAPTSLSEKNLIQERVHGKVFVTGNTIIDAVSLYVTQGCSDIMRRVPFSEFCLATVHRQENVDEPGVLRQLVAVLTEMSIPVVLPLHPRTNHRLHDFGLYEELASCPRICMLPPTGYLDTLVLMKNCKFILTDSGGLQEEATAPSIRKRVVLMRSSTERPEAVDSGFVTVAGVHKENVMAAIDNVIKNHAVELPGKSPYGDGKAAERIVDVVLRETRSGEQGDG